jgi:spore coat assembly protein
LLEFSGSSNSKMGKILHLDGDRKYGIKSERYYRKMGLNAIVKYIPEHNQPSVINQFINKYNPDIIVITGHDRHDKKESRL